MSRVASNTPMDWVKAHRRDILGWVILAAWIGVLWAMASKYWHALQFFYWIAVFIAAPLTIIFLFNFMWKGEKTKAGTKAGAPADDVEKIV